MRWFASFWLTAVVVAVTAGIWLAWVISRGGVLVPQAIVLFAIGVYALTRTLVHRVLAYTDSATEASPRGGQGKRAALGRWVIDHFHNPTGLWLGPYTVAMAALATGASAFAWAVATDGAERFAVAALAVLTGLYASTLTLAMLLPDPPIPLRTPPDVTPLDPILDLPTEAPGPAAP